MQAAMQAMPSPSQTMHSTGIVGSGVVPVVVTVLTTVVGVVTVAVTTLVSVVGETEVETVVVAVTRVVWVRVAMAAGATGLACAREAKRLARARMPVLESFIVGNGCWSCVRLKVDCKSCLLGTGCWKPTMVED